jgi:hypothetical protein
MVDFAPSREVADRCCGAGANRLGRTTLRCR